MLGAAASGPGMAGAECHRGRPRGVGLALLSWRQAWAWAWVFGRPAGTGLVGACALAAAGLLAVGTGGGGHFGGFPRGLGVSVLDEDVVVVVVDEAVVVVEVVESEVEGRAVGEGGGPWAAGASEDAGSCE